MLSAKRLEAQSEFFDPDPRRSLHEVLGDLATPSGARYQEVASLYSTS